MANFNQRLSDDITPDDPSWQAATPAERLVYFKQAGKVASAIKRAELAKGIGANGRRMKARKHPRPDGADGPVMTPHDEESRTARLLDAHADVRGMTLYWRSGHSKVQKLPWGTILGFHARGEVKGAPVRDVRLSRRGVNQVQAEMSRWWQIHHAERVAERERIQSEKRAEEERKAKRAAKIGIGRIAAKAKAAAAKRYPSLAPYLQPPGGRSGF